MKVPFHKRYFTPFLLVLVAEIAIAIFYFHRLVRGFLGDVLAIPLLYYLLRAFSTLRHKTTLIVVLFIASLVEVLQLLNFTELFEIKSSFLLIVLGNTFDWSDLLAYAFGALLVILIELNRSE